jgi:hypothetical protein
MYQLQHATLEHLGAGFYNYGQDKKLCYSNARRSLGALLGLLYVYHKNPKVGSMIDFLESEAVTSLVSLIRKIEIKRNAPQNVQGPPPARL